MTNLEEIKSDELVQIGGHKSRKGKRRSSRMHGGQAEAPPGDAPAPPPPVAPDPPDPVEVCQTATTKAYTVAAAAATHQRAAVTACSLLPSSGGNKSRKGKSHKARKGRSRKGKRKGRKSRKGKSRKGKRRSGRMRGGYDGVSVATNQDICIDKVTGAVSKAAAGAGPNNTPAAWPACEQSAADGIVQAAATAIANNCQDKTGGHKSRKHKRKSRKGKRKGRKSRKGKSRKGKGRRGRMRGGMPAAAPDQATCVTQVTTTAGKAAAGVGANNNSATWPACEQSAIDGIVNMVETTALSNCQDKTGGHKSRKGKSRKGKKQ